MIHRVAFKFSGKPNMNNDTYVRCGLKFKMSDRYFFIGGNMLRSWKKIMAMGKKIQGDTDVGSKSG